MVKPKSLRKHQKPRRPKLCETESKKTLVWSSERVREREQWRAVIWHAYAKERYNAFCTLFKRFAHLRFFIISLSLVFVCVCVFFSASSAMQTNFNVQVLETRFYLSLKDGLLIRLKVDLLWTWNKYTDLIANSNKLAEKPFCKQFQLNWPLIFNLFFLELRLVHEPQNHIDFYHSSICHGESMKTKHFGGMIYLLCVSNLAGSK